MGRPMSGRPFRIGDSMRRKLSFAVLGLALATAALVCGRSPRSGQRPEMHHVLLPGRRRLPSLLPDQRGAGLQQFLALLTRP